MASFTAGTAFQTGVANDVTADKLGLLITNATPTSGFIQDRTTETLVGVNDTLLIGDASNENNLKKITVANLLKAPLVSTSGTVDNLTTGTTTSTAQIVTSGTIATLNSTTGTIATLNSTAATITTGTFGTTTSTAATITTGTIPTLIATTLITTGTGTAAAPAIVPTGDTNTGIFFPAADTVAFSEGGAEAMRIDSSGFVGIGTSPTAKLNVYDASSASVLVQGDSVAQTIINRASTDATAPQIALRKSRGSVASPTAVASADALGLLNFQGFGGTNTRNLARISGNVETYVSDGDISANLIFLTSSTGGVTPTEKMRIDAAGNVGIGTSPTTKLDVAGEVDAKNVTVNVNTLATASGTQNLDFTSEGYLTHAITGNITYTASNYSAGRSLSVRITCDATQRNLTFPASWVFVGSKPTAIAASKVAVLSITSFGTTEANTVAAYAVQT